MNSNIRQIILDSLEDILDGEILDIKFNKLYQSKELNAKDRKFIKEVIFGIVRWKLQIEYIMSKFVKVKVKRNIKNILLLGIYQLLYLDNIPDYAAVSESVELAKRYSKNEKNFVNAILQNVRREKDKLLLFKEENFNNRIEYLSVKYSHPTWMVEFYLENFPNLDIEMILNNNNMIKKYSYRINQLKTNFEELEKLLNQKIEKSKYSDNFFYFEEQPGESIFETEVFKKGYFFVQDVSSGLIIENIDIKKTKKYKILDLCAAPGGKATYIMELCKNKAKIYLNDLNKYKMRKIVDNFTRLELKYESLTFLPGESYTSDEKFDIILLDVPCSGLGVISKKPDIKWNKTKENVQLLQETQLKILENAAKLLDDKGLIVYSTCTINPEENENIVEKFLALNPDFEIIPYEKCKEFIYKGKYFQSYPFIHEIDGAFAAYLRKKKVKKKKENNE